MARKSTDVLGQEIEALARDNEKLKAENATLKTELHQQHAFGRGWRLPIIGISVAAATAFLVVGNILFWAGDTLINTEKYSKVVSEVVEDKAVQQGIALYATNELFDNVDVNQVVQDALPPKASFLAGPLTTQLKNGTNLTLQRILATDRFQATFVQVNTQAHDTFINAVKNSKSNGVIDLQDIYDRLSDNLQNTKLSFLTGKTLPPNVGDIQVIEVEWLPKARTIVNNIGWIKPVALLFTLGFSALAIALTQHRRKLVITLGSFFGAAMLATLIAVRVLQNIIVTNTAAPYQTAVERVAAIVSQPLIAQTATILAISLLIIAVAWISGPYRAATTVRSRIQLLLSGKLHEAIFGSKENAVTRWLGAHKRFVEWLSVGVVSVIMLLVTLTPKLVLLYGLLILLIILIVETLAAPAKRR